MAPHGENSDEKFEEFEIKPKKVTVEKKTKEKNDFSDGFETLKKKANVDTFVRYAKNNTLDTIAYALLIIGFIWFLFQMFFGGLLIGLVVGYYFSKDIILFIKSLNEYVEEQGTIRSIIFAVACLVLFIAAPGIFIGAALMTGIKLILRLDK